MTLTAQNISKTLKKRKVLDDISLQLESGKVYGFVGHNGCGKTMLFRALVGLIRVDAGTVDLDGRILGKDFSVLPNVGIMLENVGLYPNLPGIQNLQVLADLNKKIGKEEVAQAITRVGLNPKDRRLYLQYSLGMKQRLALAQAIMEKPDILILDEPSNALDSEGVEMFRHIVDEERRRGAMILLASHNKEDITALADEIFEMENGGIIAHTV